MKRVLMLGAGSCQLNAIHKIKEMGHQVIVSDPYLNSKGKAIGDISILADTFSFEETSNAIKEISIDGVITSGTDQPVMTVAKIAESLSLPLIVSSQVAYNVTNKKAMKRVFSKHGIPTVDYAIVSEDFEDDAIHFPGPYVLKPLDSQGQRGIYKVKSIQDIKEKFKFVLEHSREKEILVEAYYPNRELTVSGWVQDRVEVLTVTDRVTFSSDQHIGVCISHEYPSIHLDRYKEEIYQITEAICKAFKIVKGPIYFQYLVGEEGIKVNEIACRLGGAYEDITIPYITDFDILKANIDLALGKTDPLKIKRKPLVFSTQLFFCKPGNITSMTPRDQLKTLPYVLDMNYNFQIGDTINSIENASQRAGYVIITGEDEKSLVDHIEKVYDMMTINDGEENLIIRGKRFYR